jgi:hypothetical protein
MDLFPSLGVKRNESYRVGTVKYNNIVVSKNSVYTSFPPIQATSSVHHSITALTTAIKKSNMRGSKKVPGIL